MFSVAYNAISRRALKLRESPADIQVSGGGF